MNLQDDNYLMELVKNDDKDAYDSIVKKHRSSAITFAYSFVYDLFLAEDIVQDVFVNIYVRRMNYRPVSKFRTFLFQSVRNRCIDHLRRNKVRAAADLKSISEALNCSAEDEFLIAEREKLIHELMNSLKEDYRTALYLSAAEGISYGEIAKIMKKTLPQVKILIYRARKKIKSQYREVSGDEK